MTDKSGGKPVIGVSYKPAMPYYIALPLSIRTNEASDYKEKVRRLNNHASFMNIVINLYNKFRSCTNVMAFSRVLESSSRKVPLT